VNGNPVLSRFIRRVCIRHQRARKFFNSGQFIARKNTEKTVILFQNFRNLRCFHDCLMRRKICTMKSDVLFIYKYLSLLVWLVQYETLSQKSIVFCKIESLFPHPTKNHKKATEEKTSKTKETTETRARKTVEQKKTGTEGSY